LSAQVAPGVAITGVVRSARGPLPGALVSLDREQGKDSIQVTDAAGRFSFSGVAQGSHTLRAMKIGFAPGSVRVNVGSVGVEAAIDLVALPPVLDTLRVSATRPNVIGTVVTAREWRPVGHALVSLESSIFKAETDSIGRFSFNKVPSGGYVLFAKASGLLPTMLSVVVPVDEPVEVAVELRTSAMDPNRARASLLSEFNERTRTASVMNSALIPRQELMANQKELLSYAISVAPSFLKKGLRMRVECLFINGEPAAATALNDIQVAQVEAVEVYGPGADWSQSLARRWGNRPGCGLRTTVQQPRKRTPLDSRGLVQAIVVWLRE
jgi:hypothetical protein